MCVHRHYTKNIETYFSFECEKKITNTHWFASTHSILKIANSTEMLPKTTMECSMLYQNKIYSHSIFMWNSKNLMDIIYRHFNWYRMTNENEPRQYENEYTYMASHGILTEKKNSWEYKFVFFCTVSMYFAVLRLTTSTLQ